MTLRPRFVLLPSLLAFSLRCNGSTNADTESENDEFLTWTGDFTTSTSSESQGSTGGAETSLTTSTSVSSTDDGGSTGGGSTIGSAATSTSDGPSTTDTVSSETTSSSGAVTSTAGSTEPNTSGSSTEDGSSTTSALAESSGTASGSGDVTEGSATEASSGAENEESSESSTTGVDDSICPPGPYAASPIDGIASLTFTRIEAPGLVLELEGGGLAEGPVWLGDSLLFTHFLYNDGSPSEILRYTPPDSFEVAFGPDRGVNGLALRGDGMVIGASHGIGGLVVIDPVTGDASVLVEGYQGERLNSPNDLAIRSDGNLYFTDPQFQAPDPLPQGDIKRFFRRTPEGDLLVIAEWTPGSGGPNDPNGVALSPDERTLYLGRVGGVTAYGLTEDGSVLSPGTAVPGIAHNVDGMVVDCAGNVYATNHAAGIITIIPHDWSTRPLGEPYLTLSVGAASLTNLAFGGPDRTTLFATAGNPALGSPLYSLELAIPGFPY